MRLYTGAATDYHKEATIEPGTRFQIRFGVAFVQWAITSPERVSGLQEQSTPPLQNYLHPLKAAECSGALRQRQLAVVPDRLRKDRTKSRGSLPGKTLALA